MILLNIDYSDILGIELKLRDFIKYDTSLDRVTVLVPRDSSESFEICSVLISIGIDDVWNYIVSDEDDKINLVGRYGIPVSSLVTQFEPTEIVIITSDKYSGYSETLKLGLKYNLGLDFKVEIIDINSIVLH